MIPDPTSGTHMSSTAKKLAIMFISALISLLIGELALRVAGMKFTGLTFTNDPVLGWGLRPGASAWETDEGMAWTCINSHGFRDRERTLSKPPGVFRIAVIGDSLTEARQVAMDKTYTAVAERELNRIHCLGEREVEVMNFGVEGYGTGQELLLLRNRVWHFNPDWVVLQVYAANDLFNNCRSLNVSPPEFAPYFLLRDGKLELDDSFRHGRGFDPTYIRLKGLGADLINSSKLLQMIYKLRLVYAQRKEAARIAQQVDKSVDPNAPPAGYPRFLYFQPPAIPAMVEAWRVTEALIGEFQRESREHGVPLMMLILPSSSQIHYDPKHRDAYRAMFNIASFDYADERFEQVAHTNRISPIRLAQPLLDEATRTQSFMYGFANTEPNEGHPNERGHEVIARELVRAACDPAAAAPSSSGKTP